MSSSGNHLLVRIFLHGFQLFCLLFVLTGLANIHPLITAVQAFVQGALSLPDLCWKILSVTGPLIPASGCILGAQWIVRAYKTPTHAPHEPWMANPMWANKHIKLGNGGIFTGVGFCLLCYFTVVVPLAIATEKTAIQVILGIIGLVLLVIANAVWRNRKWNTAELRMAMVPGVIGGPFSGVAQLKESFPAGTVFSVCLKCQLTSSYRNSNKGSGTSSKTETIWSSTLSIDKTLPSKGHGGTLVPFSFAVPFDCEPTREWTAESYSSIRWDLVVNRKGAEGLGGAVFKVPIYRTLESRRDFKLDTELIAPFEQEVDLAALLQRVGMFQQKLASQNSRITFGVLNYKALFSISLMMLICLACIFAAFWFVTSRNVAVFLSVFPGIMLLAGLYAWIDMLLWQSSIEIGANFLACESGWKGFRKKLVADRKDSPVFLSEFDFRKQNGEWYRVDFYLPSRKDNGVEVSGDSLTIVRQLDGEAEAKAIRRWLMQQSNVSESEAAEE